jgi:plasmid stabilization system protein ParE
MKLRHGRGALADLEEIFAYIAQDNPSAAARLVARRKRREANCRISVHRRGDQQTAIPTLAGRQLSDCL